MRIHADFPGGNIQVLSVTGDVVRVAPDPRDTPIDWFYWSFCVEGAQGRTLTFDFAPKQWVGYFGAAVRRGQADWTWTDTALPDRTGFAYTFGEAEDRVYFCHDLHYAPDRFYALAKRLALTTYPFARTRAGKETPAVVCGEGDAWLVLTARHHCCESTGNYVLEGMLEECRARPIPGLRVLAVPFMDLDGVLAGDQGKERAPHDHNRDYVGDSLYPETARMRRFAQEHAVRYALDLHSPWHIGGRNDHAFNVCPSEAASERMHRFGALLLAQTRADPMALAYDPAQDIEANCEWNMDTPEKRAFSRFFAYRDGVRFAETFETTYFGTQANRVTVPRLRALGRCLFRALAAYDREETP